MYMRVKCVFYEALSFYGAGGGVCGGNAGGGMAAVVVLFGL